MALRDHTDYPSYEIIITDDGSSISTLRKIERLRVDRIVTTAKRSGLGANANRGLAASSGDYILSLQDDWECQGPEDYLTRSVQVLQKFPRLGALRYYGLNEREHEWAQSYPDEPELMILCRPSRKGQAYHHLYSDTPHLKTLAFVRELGPYKEQCPMEESEIDYEKRFLAQTDLEIGFLPTLNNRVFIHTGEHLSFRTRKRWCRIRSAFAVGRRAGSSKDNY